MNLSDKLAVDISVFGTSMVKNIFLDSPWKRVWGAWKVLCGEAGIILVRVNPKSITAGVINEIP